MKAVRVLACTLGLLLAGPGAAAPVRLASEEWPPYVTAALPEQGLSGAYAAAVYARLGTPVHIDYYPWKRTMELGLHDTRFAGFLAVWRTPEREKLCHFSAPIANTQNVLAYLREAPVRAASLQSLRGLHLGIVAGYSNGEEFDSLVRAGVLDVQEGVNDEINLRKLLTRRFDAMVIERRVLRQLLSSGRYSKAERERIGTLEHLFHERTAHICFQRTPAGLAQQRAFNEAAREIDLPRFERDYLRRIATDLGGN